VHEAVRPTIRQTFRRAVGKTFFGAYRQNSRTRISSSSLAVVTYAVLYQRAYALTVAQWRCVIVLIRSGSSIRNRHAFAHAATIAS
jgi:hypothetical protein